MGRGCIEFRDFEHSKNGALENEISGYEFWDFGMYSIVLAVACAKAHRPLD